MNTNTNATTTKITAVTHGGVFHTDELVGLAILAIRAGGTQNIEVFRSRSLDVITDIVEKGGYALDVGGVYEPVKGQYDHHQRGGAGNRDNGVPYATAGLVWKHHAEEAVGHIAYCLGVDLTAGQMAAIIARVDDELIAVVDSIDTGHSRERIDNPLNMVVNAMKPSWLSSASGAALRAAFDAAYVAAYHYLGGVIENAIGDAIAEAEVTAALEKVEGDVLVLSRFMPWQKVLKDNPAAHPINWVVFQSLEGNWNISAVPMPGTFRDSKRLLPEAWRGLKPDELLAVSGIDDIVFCHPAGFIGGAKSQEGAIAMAKAASLAA